MCIAPINIDQVGPVACRNCWQCAEQKVADWVGRALAEAQMATACHAVTLTYEGDTPNSVVLTFTDVQKMLKRLRKYGYPVRYFCAGEYGSLKGRAHWHLVLFWQGPVPVSVDCLDQRIDWRFPPRAGQKPEDAPSVWPHGFSFIEEPNFKAIRYVMKYLRKSDRTGHDAKFSMSKKPPLGDAWFYQLALEYARQGLAVGHADYGFPGVLNKAGKPRRFQMQGATLDRFLAYYLDAWDVVRPGQQVPWSDLLDGYTDKVARSAHVPELQRRKPSAALFAQLPPGVREVPVRAGYTRFKLPRGILHCELRGFSRIENGQRQWWRLANTDGTGGWEWQSEERLMVDRGLAVARAGVST